MSRGKQPEWTWPLRCSNCRRGYPASTFVHICPACGGVYDLELPLRYDPLPSNRPGITRFQRSFPLPPRSSLPSLGEGNTPLIPLEVGDRTIYLKCEHLNPTGSFKDRGTVVMVAALQAHGILAAVEDSSGNAGASFAAYAARAGITARVFVPEAASGPKQAQIEALGAQVIRVPGPRSHAAEAVRQEVEAGASYASHVYLPFGLAGMATLAFELIEQLGEAPQTVITPVGHGSLLLGIFRGFQALQVAGRIERLPAMFGVQTRACAPLWAVQQAGAMGLGMVRENETVAEGIRILHPIWGDQVLAAVGISGGRIVLVEEDAILEGRDALGAEGFYIEPTSAVVWPALNSILPEIQDPVVVVLTGSGFKTSYR